jgi:aminoglycoside phosphotransferase (APT) family kinase protein
MGAVIATWAGYRSRRARLATRACNRAAAGPLIAARSHDGDYYAHPVQEWSAELVVDRERARRLIAGQFPSVELTSVRLLGEGWDNTVWVVDESWVFRFPRRAAAIPGVEREIAVLPRLAPLLPLPIPLPLFIGRPAEDYPWPFFGAALLAGREPADAGLTDGARTRLARPLALFLRTLHGRHVAAGLDAHALPADPMGRADMARRVPWTLQRLAEVERLRLWRPPGSIGTLLEAARALPAAEPSAVVHGDLHVRHLLVDAAGALTGVIDWGDLCRADPSIDLMLLWSFLPPQGRLEFLAACGPIGQEQMLRARVLALFLSATLLLYSHHEGMTNLRREAIDGLTRAATD